MLLYNESDHVGEIVMIEICYIVKFDLPQKIEIKDAIEDSTQESVKLFTKFIDANRILYKKQ
jgi:hypothetical protein